MSEHPSIEDVREAFVLTNTRNHDSYMTGVPLADIRGVYADAFDAWLSEHDRQVAERAWDQAYMDGRHDERVHIELFDADPHHAPNRVNPHRATKGEQK